MDPCSIFRSTQSILFILPPPFPKGEIGFATVINIESELRRMHETQMGGKDREEHSNRKVFGEIAWKRSLSLQGRE